MLSAAGKRGHLRGCPSVGAFWPTLRPKAGVVPPYLKTKDFPTARVRSSPPRSPVPPSPGCIVLKRSFHCLFLNICEADSGWVNLINTSVLYMRGPNGTADF